MKENLSFQYVRRAGVLLWVLLGWGLPASASVYPVPISLPNLVSYSQSIVMASVGRVEAWSTRKIELELNLPCKTLELGIQRLLKGTTSIRFPLSCPRMASPVSQGDRILWFLTPEAASGALMPLGL